MDEVISRVERALADAESEGFTPEIEQVFIDDLPTVILLARKSLDRIKDQSHGG